MGTCTASYWSSKGSQSRDRFEEQTAVYPQFRCRARGTREQLGSVHGQLVCSSAARVMGLRLLAPRPSSWPESRSACAVQKCCSGLRGVRYAAAPTRCATATAGSDFSGPSSDTPVALRDSAVRIIYLNRMRHASCSPTLTYSMHRDGNRPAAHRLPDPPAKPAHRPPLLAPATRLLCVFLHVPSPFLCPVD